MEKMEEPTILESGNTIDLYFMKRLIKNKKKDPFDSSRPWNKIIKNLMAKEIFEMISIFNQKLNDLNTPCFTSKGIQTKLSGQKVSRSWEANLGGNPPKESVCKPPKEKNNKEEKEYNSLKQEIDDLKFKLNFTKQVLKESKKDLKKANQEKDLKVTELNKDIKQLRIDLEIQKNN